MTVFDDQYFVSIMPFGDDQLYLKPDEKTFNRRYTYKKMDQGGAPLFFENAFKERDIRDGKSHPITSVLMNGSNLLVNNAIRDKLKFKDIQGMQLYPAIYIDDDFKWHEEHWFLNFYEAIDCWDRDTSTIESYDDEDEDEDDDDPIELDSEVIRYRLDADILDKIPEERRLMFKMGGALKSYIFVHQKVVDLFKDCDAVGVRFIKVSEFKEGDQFRA